jgi:hypothetical protein
MPKTTFAIQAKKIIQKKTNSLQKGGGAARNYNLTNFII